MSRWAACPGRVALSAGLPNKTSQAASEGTCAHDLADACLTAKLDADLYFGATREADGYKFTVDDEMVDGVQLYLDTVRADFDPSMGDIMHSEIKFDLSLVYPGLYGTNDAVVWKPASRTGQLRSGTRSRLPGQPDYTLRILRVGRRRGEDR